MICIFRVSALLVYSTSDICCLLPLDTIRSRWSSTAGVCANLALQSVSVVVYCRFCSQTAICTLPIVLCRFSLRGVWFTPIFPRKRQSQTALEEASQRKTTANARAVLCLSRVYAVSGRVPLPEQ